MLIGILPYVRIFTIVVAVALYLFVVVSVQTL